MGSHKGESMSELVTVNTAIDELIKADYDPVYIDNWARRIAERGDGIALYENHDLGHPEVGDLIALSYGSSEAMVESMELPESCPVDLGAHGKMAWRYVLVAYTNP